MKLVYTVFFALALGLIVSAFSTNPPSDSRALSTTANDSVADLLDVDPVRLDSAEKYIRNYGRYIGKNDPDVACEVPVFWSVSAETIETALRDTASPSGHADTLRFYLAKNHDTLKLFVVPVTEGREDLNSIYNLIYPCPASCDQEAQGVLHEAFYEGVCNAAELPCACTLAAQLRRRD